MVNRLSYLSQNVVLSAPPCQSWTGHPPAANASIVQPEDEELIAPLLPRIADSVLQAEPSVDANGVVSACEPVAPPSRGESGASEDGASDN